MLYLGTSGWPREGDWAGLSPRHRRERYFRLFNSIEITETYRRVPDWELVSRRRAQAPEGFVYSWVAPQHLTYLPDGGERRALRRALRRHKRLGRARGGVRFIVPKQTDRAAFAAWLEMLAELGLPGDYAFELPAGWDELPTAYGWVVVNRPAAWQYQLDSEPVAEVRGYAYYGSLAAALRHQRKVAPERG